MIQYLRSIVVKYNLDKFKYNLTIKNTSYIRLPIILIIIVILLIKNK